MVYIHVCMFAPCYSLGQPCIVYVVVVLVLSLWCTEYDATMAWHASLYITHEWPHTVAGMKPKIQLST